MVLGNHNTVHHITPWWPALMATVVVMLASTAGTLTVRTPVGGRPGAAGEDGERMRTPVLLAGSPSD
jgi:hypothetical protein